MFWSFVLLNVCVCLFVGSRNEKSSAVVGYTMMRLTLIIDYLNEKHMKFNKKLELFYGQYTSEIKQNLERNGHLRTLLCGWHISVFYFK
jgi:hypothetical protein